MAIVIPRARSSGALSIDSNERYSASPFSASTFVIAAVSVVFPWSTCPIVPTFTCGFVRSNFFLAIGVPFRPRRRGQRYPRRVSVALGGEGAHDQIRTGDLVLTKNALCRLSYVGKRGPVRAGPNGATGW